MGQGSWIVELTPTIEGLGAEHVRQKNARKSADSKRALTTPQNVDVSAGFTAKSPQQRRQARNPSEPHRRNVTDMCVPGSTASPISSSLFVLAEPRPSSLIHFRPAPCIAGLSSSPIYFHERIAPPLAHVALARVTATNFTHPA
ncbi:hypothetical protein KM043_010918 [Ampulex compressa]|nr:hypothetical protein KM043_010918 [Ampulex compressa]